MARLQTLKSLLALCSVAAAQCGSGSPDVSVTGSDGAYVATAGSSEVYSGPDYLAAIQGAIDAASSGQRIAVIFEGCGTIDVAIRNGYGALEVLNAADVQSPYLSMKCNPYFGLHFYGVSGLILGKIDMNLRGGIGIRFDRDEASKQDVTMGTITVTGAGSHAVEMLKH